jgi:predicted transcriptional regulator
MPKRRTNFEITAKILETAKDGANKTRIVYGTNLNFKLATAYLDNMEKVGLITRKSKIRTTEKGFEYLKQYSQIREMIR